MRQPLLLLALFLTVSCSAKKSGTDSGTGSPPPEAISTGDFTTSASFVPTTTANANITISWESVDNASSYDLLTGADESVPTVLVAGLNGLTHTYSRASSYTPIYYSVLAKDAGGNVLGRSNVTSVKPIGNISLTNFSDYQFSFDLTQQTHTLQMNIRGADFYEVEYGTTSGVYTDSITTTPSQSGSVTVNVTPGQTYYYRVSARNTVNGDYKVSYPEYSKYAYSAQPTNVVATLSGDENSVSISWDASPNATSYRIVRTGVQFSNWSLFNYLSSFTNPYDHNSLETDAGFLTRKRGETVTQERVGNAEVIATGVTGTSFVDNNLGSGKLYYYHIQTTSPTNTPLHTSPSATVERTAQNYVMRRNFNSPSVMTIGEGVSLSTGISDGLLNMDAMDSDQNYVRNLGTTLINGKEDYLLEGVIDSSIGGLLSGLSFNLSNYETVGTDAISGSFSLPLKNPNHDGVTDDIFEVQLATAGGPAINFGLSELNLKRGFFRDFVNYPQAVQYNASAGDTDQVHFEGSVSSASLSGGIKFTGLQPYVEYGPTTQYLYVRKLDTSLYATEETTFDIEVEYEITEFSSSYNGFIALNLFDSSIPANTIEYRKISRADEPEDYLDLGTHILKTKITIVPSATLTFEFSASILDSVSITIKKISINRL